MQIPNPTYGPHFDRNDARRGLRDVREHEKSEQERKQSEGNGEGIMNELVIDIKRQAEKSNRSVR